jgi:imidazolonepropionase-like amidohydrolase
MSPVTVAVENGTILAVTPDRSRRFEGFQQIDGTGRYLIPGLWDSHVHLTKAGANSLAVFIANGVTSVRDMGSDPAEVAQWRAEIAAGQRIGPRIKMAGPILESAANVARMKREGTVEPVGRIRMPVANPEEARAAVARIAKLGADHIKMRTAPDMATFLAAIEAAKQHGLPFASHPFGSVEEFVSSGVASAEHGISFEPLRAIGLERNALMGKVNAAKLWISTTLVNLEGSILVPHERAKQLLEDTEGRLDPRRRYVGGYLIADWREQVEENRERPLERIRTMLPAWLRDFRALHGIASGVLAGTDVGVAFMYPGFSLHDELKLYVDQLGLSPMQALRAATVNPSEFYGMSRELGGIRAGHRADLVLLDANPIDDIANTRRISGVMAAGRWFNRAALDRLLEEAAREASRMREPSRGGK